MLFLHQLRSSCVFFPFILLICGILHFNFYMLNQPCILGIDPLGHGVRYNPFNMLLDFVCQYFVVIMIFLLYFANLVYYIIIINNNNYSPFRLPPNIC